MTFFPGARGRYTSAHITTRIYILSYVYIILYFAPIIHILITFDCCAHVVGILPPTCARQSRRLSHHGYLLYSCCRASRYGKNARSVYCRPHTLSCLVPFPFSLLLILVHLLLYIIFYHRTACNCLHSVYTHCIKVPRIKLWCCVRLPSS